MGHKVNPIGMRLQVNRTWDSRWYADTKDYGDLLLEDIKIREFIEEECKQAGVSKIIIERPHRKCRVTIHTARPGVIIGRKGSEIEVLRKKLAAMTDSELHLNIVEVRKPELDAAAGGRKHRPAAGASRFVPPRHEAGGAERHAHGCAGHPGERRGSPRRRRDRPDGVVSRGPRAAAHAAGRHRLCPRPKRRRLTASSASRSGSSKARSWSTIRRPVIASNQELQEGGGPRPRRDR
jgi:hypothetical protein